MCVCQKGQNSICELKSCPSIAELNQTLHHMNTSRNMYFNVRRLDTSHKTCLIISLRNLPMIKIAYIVNVTDYDIVNIVASLQK